MISSLSSWILSIAGVVILSCIGDLVLPDGKLQTFIKNIFGLVTIFVLISPVPKLLNKKIDFSSLLSYSQIEIDENFLYQQNIDKIELLKSQIEKEILSYGYENVSVYINCNIVENTLTFKSVSVDLSRLVISKNAEHYDITKIKIDISEIVSSYIDIDKESILYEQ